MSSGGLGSLGLLSALPSSSKKKVSKCLRSVTENEDDDASVFTTKTLQTLQSQHTNAAKSVSSRSYYSRVHDEASIVDIIKDKTRAKLKKKQLPRNPQILKTYKQWEIYHLENGRLYSTIRVSYGHKSVTRTIQTVSFHGLYYHLMIESLQLKHS